MNNATRWIVPTDHPAFDGHFPGNPILPGVVLLDKSLHAIAAATGFAMDGCEINSVKFLSPASPGASLEIRHFHSAKGTIRFEIMSDMKTIAIGNIVPKPTS